MHAGAQAPAGQGCDLQEEGAERPQRQGQTLRAEALAALGATRGQDLLAVLGRHARTEPVAPLALQVARLKSSFGGHGSQPLLSFAEAGNYVIEGGKSSNLLGAI